MRFRSRKANSTHTKLGRVMTVNEAANCSHHAHTTHTHTLLIVHPTAAYFFDLLAQCLVVILVWFDGLAAWFWTILQYFGLLCVFQQFPAKRILPWNLHIPCGISRMFHLLSTFHRWLNGFCVLCQQSKISKSGNYPFRIRFNFNLTPK